VTDIEFLDPGVDSDVVPGVDPGAAAPAGDVARDAGGAPTQLRRWLPAIVAALGWLTAAGFAVMASVSVVYRLVYHGDGQTQSVAVDAWGRFDKPQLAVGLGHGPRFAIVLVGAAALLLAAALVGVVRVGVARYLGVAGLAVVAAMAATVYLQADAMRSTYAARQRQLGTAAADQFRLHVQTGSATWLAIAAVVLAAAGTAGAFLVTESPAVALAALGRDEDGPEDAPDLSEPAGVAYAPAPASAPPADGGRAEG